MVLEKAMKDSFYVCRQIYQTNSFIVLTHFTALIFHLVFTYFRGKEKKSFHLLIHSPNVHGIQDWAEIGARR